MQNLTALSGTCYCEGPITAKSILAPALALQDPTAPSAAGAASAQLSSVGQASATRDQWLTDEESGLLVLRGDGRWVVYSHALTAFRRIEEEVLRVAAHHAEALAHQLHAAGRSADQSKLDWCDILLLDNVTGTAACGESTVDLKGEKVYGDGRTQCQCCANGPLGVTNAGMRFWMTHGSVRQTSWQLATSCYFLCMAPTATHLIGAAKTCFCSGEAVRQRREPAATCPHHILWQPGNSCDGSL